ncbi:MAG: DNA-3-methyladenine glycosylase 2 [Rhodanobacteraceae bacterium]|nr:DNA-3-methyladenine glycosylase 2 [Rhodanobacteraceae bacterium]
MTLDPAAAYTALVSRDRRFDGRFFVAVTTTGIYCRPICRVRTPKASSCRFFEHAAAAESAGFRPCLRCRPELAPGVSLIDSPDALAQAAARLLDAGVGDAGLGAVAARVGVTERHLRRVFVAHYGVTPVAWLQTQRLLLAKRLLTETALPVGEVALAAGFHSLRRFNALFRERYRLAPTQLRRDTPAVASEGLTLALDYRPPYAWDAILAFLRARAVPGVEQVVGDGYRRIVRMAAGGSESLGWIEVRHLPQRSQLLLTVDPDLRRALAPLLAGVRRQFDLDCDPHRVSAVLGELAAGEPGLRLPGSIDSFEQAVRAILGQQVSVAAATTLAGRMAQSLGTPVQTVHAGLTHAFPDAARVAAAGESELSALGILATRARSIQALARALVAGELRLDPDAPVEPTLERLRALPGIGEWTAQYIALRCLSWPDAFPHTDLIIRRAFVDQTPRAVLAAAERWRPWRGYATLHLWRQS